MLQRVSVPFPERHWQRLLADAITDPRELIDILALPVQLLPAAQAAAKLFPLRVPRGFVARMRPGDPGDPLLRQVLPLAAEQDAAPGYSTDPVGDGAALTAPGVLHKYHGRALLITTGACAVHCRYCFRRHFPYAESGLSQRAWTDALDYIRDDTSISEIILSGGDPLALSDGKLAAMAADLATISHLRRLRIHSRLPVVLPERIGDDMLRWFAHSRLQPVMVVHANHAQELDSDVAVALQRLLDAGVMLLNQSVLLRGVNDDVETLRHLSERLGELRVTPYYIHALDRVRGAAHFDVPEADAQRLYAQLLMRLPGYLVPRLVRESPGAPNKTPLPPA